LMLFGYFCLLQFIGGVVFIQVFKYGDEQANIKQK
jgi:hypothetical protein